MKTRWKPPKSERSDAEALRREREFQRKLAHVLEYGTEDDFVDVLKTYQPEVMGEELRQLIMQFRALLREKRGL